jgi:hypothetical protein
MDDFAYGVLPNHNIYYTYNLSQKEYSSTALVNISTRCIETAKLILDPCLRRDDWK